jgi:hypothetical protein
LGLVPLTRGAGLIRQKRSWVSDNLFLNFGTLSSEPVERSDAEPFQFGDDAQDREDHLSGRRRRREIHSTRRNGCREPEKSRALEGGVIRSSRSCRTSTGWVAAQAEIALPNGKTLYVFDAFYVEKGEIIEQSSRATTIRDLLRADVGDPHGQADLSGISEVTCRKSESVKTQYRISSANYFEALHVARSQRGEKPAIGRRTQVLPSH